MVNTHEKTRMQKFTEGLSKFLSNNWKIIIIVLAVSVIVVAGLGISANIRNKKIENAAEAQGALEVLYEEDWFGAEEDAKDAVKEEILTSIQTIQSDYPGTYAAQKALFIGGNIAYESEDWASASESYAAVADEFGESFLAPVALMYAAAALEELEDAAGAKKLYDRVVEEYPEAVQEVMRARFSSGRISEGLGDINTAVEMYNSLIDEDSQDPWAMLAQSRLLHIAE